MRAITCSSCGATLPISLAAALPSSGSLPCASCQAPAQLGAEVVAEVEQSCAVLAGLDERERQLDATGRRALSASSRLGLRTLAVLVATLVPLAACTAGAGVLLLGQEVPSPSVFAFFAAPFVLGVAAAALGAGAMQRANRALELVVAARPPSRPGEPACCRVCGGPLAVGAEALARCEFCRADNLVSAPVLERASAARAQDLGSAANEIVARATGLSSVARRARSVGLATLFLAPLVSFGALLVVALIAAEIETAPHRELQYALVETSAGRCVALVSRYSDHVRLSYGGTSIPYQDRPDVAGLELRGPDLVTVGARMKTMDAGRPIGAVTAVFGDLLGANQARLRLDSGSEVDRPLAGLCLAGPPPGG